MREVEGSPKTINRYSHFARRWLRQVWKQAPGLVDDPPREVVTAVQRTMRRQRRQRVAVRWTLRGLVPAACAVALVLGFRHRAPAPSFQAAPRAAAPSAGGMPEASSPAERPELFVMSEMAEAAGLSPSDRRVPPGGRLSAPATQPIRIGTLDGTSVTLEPSTTLTAIEVGATKRFDLTAGAIRAKVKKLASDERFIIDTADAEVEVHGTQFRVVTLPGTSPTPSTCPVATRTRVSVSEGIVSVRWSGHETRLFPGQAWPAGCVAPEPVTSPALAPATAPADTGRRAGARASAQRPPGRRVAATAGVTHGHVAAVAAATTGAGGETVQVDPMSSLAGQNDLFSSALRAKRSGRARRAIELFDRFVRSYPASPLVESALAQRMRLLAQHRTEDSIGDQRSSPGSSPEASARAAAADYLARFPDGFARAEARALVARTGAPP